VLIIDSIQNCYTRQAQTIPGSIGQLRESAFLLMRLAKENDIAIIVSGHITKQGNIAGPKTLEHMVDGVFYLQGEDRWQTRVLRSVKNRFGTINELGFFEMGQKGLSEVPNINQHLLSEISHSPGSVLISFLEGSRPLLLELQALTIASKLGIPQRVISGIDHKQVVLIAAILEKYLQVKLSMHDIFFKVSGGFKIKGSATDLGIALALLSSYFQQPVPEKSIALGEISLTGQIKPINPQEQKPDVLIIDSIQNCYTRQAQTIPGSIGQLRESAFLLMRLAKENDIAIIVSGHITKQGNIAGPKTLEHMVDGVFYLQGEDRWQTRVLRSVKNRFGTINELGFFEMGQKGLSEVPNINQHLLSEISHSPGSVLISFLEGSRPLLLELQALTIASKLGIPQRVISGIDHKQVVLIAAILEKYLQVKLSMHDIFFKVSGGFKIKGSATDLGIALALLSSYFQQPVPEKSIALGEISLTGQIKPINQMNVYMKEAEKFGIEQILVAHNQKMDRCSCTVKRFKNVYELLMLFDGK